MTGKIKFSFWNYLATIVLRFRFLVVFVLLSITLYLGLQWKHIGFSFTEANLLPDHHPINVEYQKFVSLFGEEGNVILLAIKDSAIFSPRTFTNWSRFNQQLERFEEIEQVLSVTSLKKMIKKEDPPRFVFRPISKDTIYTTESIISFRKELFDNLPFYKDIVYSSKSRAIQSVIYLKPSIVNTFARKEFIQKTLQPLLTAFEQKNKIDIRASGMPYIRTMNSQNILNEMEVFVFAALAITSLIFFLFFRSLSATIIAMTAVIIGVMWAFGILGVLRYEITVLTAIIPPLVIVIGIPNCIFLINKYQQEFKKNKNQKQALVAMVIKVGNATLMTNITTASGFASFAFTDSTLLKEFGIVASINIVALFILCLLFVTVAYSFLPVPNSKQLRHLDTVWVKQLVDWMVRLVKKKRIKIYICATLIILASLIGMRHIRVSGSLLEDMPKKAPFFKDIIFFEDEFGGIMPLEILIDTQKKQGARKLSTWKKIEKFESDLAAIPELSPPISLVRLIKYAKQVFYNGNPRFFEIPTRQELNFIYSYIKDLDQQQKGLKNYVDSSNRYIRLTTYMKDVGTEKMKEIEQILRPKIQKLFPSSRYTVTFTGKALIFQKGTEYLVRNLSVSLGLAVFLIALFMAWMFGALRMIIIALVPNLLPLLMTAGLMGYLGVPIKPSTILVFSIAFGISVDDTIHFLAKYRQELLASSGNIKKAVLISIKETGVSMFYTSTVLFFGFSVFMLSSFGGTQALGGLVSITLLFAMLTNLLLLPALLLSLEKYSKPSWRTTKG